MRIHSNIHLTTTIHATDTPHTMICRTCIRRATTLGRQSILPKAPVRKNFSTTIAPKQAAATAAAPATDATKIDDTAAAAAPAAALRSICVEGTVLNGLNYFKGKTDPVARKDEEYPEWLWSCLDVQKKAEDADDTDAGDQWCRFQSEFHFLPYPPFPLFFSTING